MSRGLLSRVPILTRRWNDPPFANEGHRLLVTRYRPRGITKAEETWDEWLPALGPSKSLHAAVYTEKASPVSWPVYRRNYIEEQRTNIELIDALAARIRGRETLTLLCSSACTRESRCHRSILRGMIETAAETSQQPT